MSQSVFVSYARKTNQENARALHRALGADVCFLDERDIELGATFPVTLTDALLAARVVVVFPDATYFQRWFCLREWMLARAPFDELLRRGANSVERDAAIEHVVVAITDDMSDGVLRRLPPVLQNQNWPSANATDSLAALVRAKLTACRETLLERCERTSVALARRGAMVDEAAIPPAHNVAGIPMHPRALPSSLRDGFVGRVDDMWRLHSALTESRMGSQQIAALTVAVQSGGGFGKTRLALEYLHRFGPSNYSGGLFWIDAAESEPLERQFHGVLHELRPATPPIEEMRELGRDVRAEVARALHEDAASKSILFVVDNVPEPKSGVAPSSLDRWCPALGRVTCLATSRKRLDDAGVATIELDVLEPEPAVALLTSEVKHFGQLQRAEWCDIAEWVGRLPLALALLNAALRKAVVSPKQLGDHRRGAGMTEVLDAQMAALRGTVPAGTLRGVTEALALSYDLLDDEAKLLARRIGCLAPAPLPDELLHELSRDSGGAQARAMLVDRSFIVEGRSTDGWRMHRVLADFVRARGEDAHGEQMAVMSTLRLVLDAIDLEQPTERKLATALISHALAAAELLAASTRAAAERATSAEWSVIERVAENLGSVGYHAGERTALEDSIALHRIALSLAARDRVPMDWAATQGSLGSVLNTLGEGEDGTQHLEEAVAACRAALEVYTRERAPLEWAATQDSLGKVLKTLGERAAGTQHFEEAVLAYRSALEVRTRDRAPVEWAETQHSLGTALFRAGQREQGPQHLEEAVAALRPALEVRTRDRAPRDWAMTQNILGLVLHDLGAREQGTQRLEQALAAHQSALEVRTRERAPLEWAVTQNNLGLALTTLGEREQGAQRFEQAVAAFQSALEIYTRDRAPLQWAMTQSNLSIALKEQGTRNREPQKLRDAVAACRSALEVLTREGAPLNWAMAQHNLGTALHMLGAQEKGTQSLEEAVVAYRSALTVLESVEAASYVQTATLNLRRAEELLIRRRKRRRWFRLWLK